MRPGQQVNDVTIPLSVILEVARRSLETTAFFPPELRPGELGDGAVVERRGRHQYLVHERFETGQMRFSELRSHFHFSLRGALRRYLRHYQTELKSHQAHIRNWK